MVTLDYTTKYIGCFEEPKKTIYTVNLSLNQEDINFIHENPEATIVIRGKNFKLHKPFDYDFMDLAKNKKTLCELELEFLH